MPQNARRASSLRTNNTLNWLLSRTIARPIVCGNQRIFRENACGGKSANAVKSNSHCCSCFEFICPDGPDAQKTCPIYLVPVGDFPHFTMYHLL
jgi:hypothetical protein